MLTSNEEESRFVQGRSKLAKGSCSFEIMSKEDESIDSIVNFQNKRESRRN